MAVITTRFEIKIPPDKRTRYEAAAKDARMSLSAWMQQAADRELERTREIEKLIEMEVEARKVLQEFTQDYRLGKGDTK